MFELHIIELCKTLKGKNAVNDWIQLFNADTMEGLNMMQTKNAGVMEAVEVVRRMNLGKMLIEPYESYMKAKMDRRAEDEYVRNKGISQGIEQGKAEGKAEYILQALNRFGDIPQELQERILAEKSLSTLDAWFEAAMNAGSLQEFKESIGIN